ITSMPASRRARAMILAPRSWPSRPGLATTTRILRPLGPRADSLSEGAESMGLPVPGETALLAAALLAHEGTLAIVPVIAIAATAAIVGDNLGYLVGRHGGR